MKMKLSKLFVPSGKFPGLMSDMFVLRESELAAEVTNAGFVIESQWYHGMKDIGVFMMARKICGKMHQVVDCYSVELSHNKRRQTD
jgi:hypothetical protein